MKFNFSFSIVFTVLLLVNNSCTIDIPQRKIHTKKTTLAERKEITAKLNSGLDSLIEKERKSVITNLSIVTGASLDKRIDLLRKIQVNLDTVRFDFEQSVHVLVYSKIDIEPRTIDNYLNIDEKERRLFISPVIERKITVKDRIMLARYNKRYNLALDNLKEFDKEGRHQTPDKISLGMSVNHDPDEPFVEYTYHHLLPLLSSYQKLVYYMIIIQNDDTINSSV